jgi:phage tail-like protein
MTRNRLRQYHFKNESQWKACLFAQNDHGALRSESVFRPFPPFAEESIRCAAPGTRAPVVLRNGEILWSDNGGLLHRNCTGDGESDVSPAPPSIACANRLVSTAAEIWVGSMQGTSVECYDGETLARLLTVELPDARILDIAGESGHSLFVLVDRDEKLQCLRISTSGHELSTVSFVGISQAKAFVFLRQSRQFVLLAGEPHPCLYWFPVEGGRPVFSKPVGAIQVDFRAELLGSDSKEIILLAGSSKDPSAPGARVLVLDADGNQLGQLPLEAPATGIAAAPQTLVVTNAQGLLRYTAADTVPNNTSEVRCTLLTPMLQSLDPEDSLPWLRIEASTTLPQGTTLELAYAAADDPKVCQRLKAVMEDARLPESQRIYNLLGDPALEWTSTIFHGKELEPNETTAPFSAPLFNVSSRYLWVSVTLTASRGARLPVLNQLAVLYPGRSLVENLPAPYRRAAAQPEDFLRSLVGVLEATTQDLDARIAVLGSHIHPAAATGPWLDYIARWLGLPWDDTLSGAQKRAILQHAALLAQGRGTRSGLETLLACLLPGSPRRFRVTDTMVEYGYAVVGGDNCAGSALPAMLGGFTRWRAELNATTVLDYTRLPCPGQSNEGAIWPAAQIRIEVAAGYQEREASEPWLLSLIMEMVPLDVSVDLRWVSAAALRTDRLDGSLVLEAPPSPYLSSDAVTGLTRLPEQRRTRLTDSGPAMNTPLR